MEHMTKKETIALREKHIGKSCQLFFRQDPLKIIKAKGQYMYDEKGDAYLDCINNVAHVGHCHPSVVRAGCEQMTLLNTNNRFLHDNIVLCARRLISTMPKNLSVCYFVNSGSEANDLALRLAQVHTGNRDVVTLEQGRFRDSDHPKERLTDLYAGEIAKICDEIKKNDRGVCAYIAESLLSCGGQIIPPENYLKRVYELIREAGGVCIADEVQVGFGRIGKHWWGFELQEVVPDIVTMGKPMGNGHPIAAVITTEEIAESFRKTGVEYFNTYGGNPVSCAIANAVFDTIERENLRERALVVGEYLLDECQALADKHKCIGDVRGVGLFVGIELVKDRETRIPDKECATYVVSRMRDAHILVSADGPDCNVIKLKPPMVFSKENVDEFVTTMNTILKEVAKTQNVSSGTQKAVEAPSKEPRQRKTIKEEQIKSI